MTPQPPTPPEGSSLPPRHRPSLGSLNQDTTELDLWAFDDDEYVAGTPESPQAVTPAPRPVGSGLPAAREISLDMTRDSGDGQAPKPAAGEELIRMNVNRGQGRSRPVGPATASVTTEDEFDDLEPWDMPPVQTEPPPLPVAAADAFTPPESPPETADVTGPPPSVSLDAAPSAVVEAPLPAEEVDEFAPVAPAHAVPVSLRPRLGLSMVERIGLIGLLALLIVGGGVILVFSLARLPTETKRAKANDFPIKGTRLTIESAASYWRVPIPEGPGADTVRRGTQLLPVLELKVSGGPATIRVLFRNEDRAVIGDAVTRTVSGGGMLQIPATAGFDDLGMHAAYRTGESKAWTIEVLESPSEDTTGREFKKLFELNISTDRR